MAGRIWNIQGLQVSLIETLNEKYESPLSYGDLYEFSKKLSCKDDLDCWKAISEWKKLYSTRQDGQNREVAGDIIKKYISPQATVAQVNILPLTAGAIKKAFDQGMDSNLVILFAEVNTQLENIILKEVFPRFLQTAEIKLHTAHSKKLAMWWLYCDVKSPREFFCAPDVANGAESRIHQYLTVLEITLCLLVGIFAPTYWYYYLYIVYCYFVRIISGPRLCPNAWLVLFVLYPICTHLKLVQGNLSPAGPKRFAELIGLVFSTLYCILYKTVANPWYARGIAIMHIACSAVAALTGFCLGCHCFGLIIKVKAMWNKMRCCKNQGVPRKVYVQPLPTDSVDPDGSNTINV